MTTSATSSSDTTGSLPNSDPTLSHFSPPPAPHISIKLTATNYLLWQMQLLPLLTSFDLSKFVDGTFPAPSCLLPDDLPNPAYDAWRRRDQLVFSWIVGSLTDAVLSRLVGCSTALEAWTRLASAYGTGNRQTLCSLRTQYGELSRGNDSCIKFLTRAQEVADRLAALNHPVSDDELVDRCLRGLGEDFLPFVRTLEAKLEPISFADFHGLLINEEHRLRQLGLLHDGSTPQANYGRFGGRGGGGRGRFTGRSPGRGCNGHGGRGDHFPSTDFSNSFVGPGFGAGLLGTRPINRSSSTSGGPLRCYTCQGFGHLAKHCPNLTLTNRYSPSSNYASSSSTPQDWIMDSGTNYHITFDLNNLALHSEYAGPDEVAFGNGNSLPISHSGSSLASFHHHPLRLNNILHVPSASHNLLSINSLTRTNPLSINF
ncbi:unnamed protein product [Linum trigynum]|uniref:CCHC-type domain-containing protein n=1 Tax=Linum trigynum TaxID=586398 RepID=A0AAV2GI06_9ROSI